MLKLSEIKELIKLVDQTSIQEVEIENEGSRLLIRKPNKTDTVVVSSAPLQPSYPQIVAPPPVQPAAQDDVRPAPAPEPSGGQAPTEETGLHRIVSPMVGTFYRAPSPGAAPYVEKGDPVKEKTVVCIIEAMKLMNEIEAEVSGEIVDILAENGQLVEYGQPLFLVRLG